MIVRVTRTLSGNMLQQMLNAIDAGATGGYVEFYTGTQPATPETATSGQILLGTCTFSTTSGTLTMAAITSDSAADATGVAAWARIKDSTGSVVCDCDVTTTGAGGAIQMPTTSIVVGGPIGFTSFTLTFD